MKVRIFSPTTSIWHCPKDSSQPSKVRKNLNDNIIGKEVVKQSSFIKTRMVSVKYPLESKTNRLINLICEVNKVVGYKMNIQNQLDFYVLAIGNWNNEDTIYTSIKNIT